MSDADTVMPYFDLSTVEGLDLFMASDDQKRRVLDKVFTAEGHSLDEVPEVWAAEPLRIWCWLVLTVNGLELDPDVHKPLIHWGIDLGFSSTAVRQFFWFLA